MNPKQAIDAARWGRLVDCSPSDWVKVRAALEDAVAEHAKAQDWIRCILFDEEIRRLDAYFTLPPEELAP